MFRSQSNVYLGPSNNKRKYIIYIFCYLLGLLCGWKVNSLQTKDKKSVLITSQSTVGVNHQEDHSINKTTTSVMETNTQLKKELEQLQLLLKSTEQKLASFQEVSSLIGMADHLGIPSYNLVELSLANSSNVSSGLRELCLINTSVTASVGDLIVAQGALLGEVQAVNHPCLKMIPVHSRLSSFEVRLEYSGIRGIAIGLGQRDQSLDELEISNTPLIKTAAMRLKYLERSVPAVLGERALLIRKSNEQSESLVKVKGGQRLPSLAIGEVVHAQIDENGLFQSAFLTPSLTLNSINYALILSQNPSPK